jgi:transcriptional regulator with XRE-family HTH domain
MQAQSLGWQNDFGDGDGYYRRMADPRHDWFLKEWLKASGKKQADIVRDLDWNKAKVSLMANGKQAYTREEVNELAAYLNIRPHELLMHPDDAHSLRRLKAEMIRLVHESETEEAEKAPKKVSLN